MRIFHRFLGLAIVLMTITETTYGQFLGFKIIGDKKRVEIPFETYNNLIVIPVMINNVFPVKFIVDTGVRSAILTEKSISDFLNLYYSRTITLVGAIGGEGIEAHIAPNISLQLPGVQGAGQALLVLEKDYLKLSSNLGTEVHGIIGYEIFSRFIVEINYVKKVLTLYEPAFFKPRRGYKKIPVAIEDTKPYITGTVTLENGCTIESKLLIDTGASHSLLLHLASHKDIELPEKTIATTLGKGLEGTIMGKIGRTPLIEFGGFSFSKVITSFPERETYKDIIAFTERHGTIGGGITNKFNIVFDYFQNNIYLKKNANFKKKFNYNMSGLDVMVDDNDLHKFIISEVIKDSPAYENDIRIGDIILSVNNISASHLKLNELHHIFRYKENKKIKLKIERDGEVIKKSFRLRQII